MKFLLSIIILLSVMTSRINAQDVSLNLDAMEDANNDDILDPATEVDGTWTMGSEDAYILITIHNTSSGTSVPAYKLRPLISLPAILQIDPVQPALPAGWSILSNLGNSIRLCNGTDQIGPQSFRQIAIHIKLVSTGANQVSGTMGFGNGGAACGSGPQTLSNATANDNSQVGFVVLPNASLPINLLNFEGSVNDCKTTLKWKVSQDSNSELFEVEQSSDGQRFSSAGSVTATAGREAYELKVPHTGGKLYYRLKMKDQDEKTTYSQVVRVTSACGASADLFRVYPNPVVSSWFRLEFGKAGKYDVQLINAAGATVRHQQVEAAAGQVTEVNNVHYPAGMYVVKVTDAVSGIAKYSKLVINNTK